MSLDFNTGWVLTTHSSRPSLSAAKEGNSSSIVLIEDGGYYEGTQSIRQTYKINTTDIVVIGSYSHSSFNYYLIIPRKSLDETNNNSSRHIYYTLKLVPSVKDSLEYEKGSSFSDVPNRKRKFNPAVELRYPDPIILNNIRTNSQVEHNRNPMYSHHYQHQHAHQI
jgi:hypothetical protein